MKSWLLLSGLQRGIPFLVQEKWSLEQLLPDIRFFDDSREVIRRTADCNCRICYESGVVGKIKPILKTLAKQSYSPDVSVRFISRQSKGHESAICAARHQSLETAPDIRGVS